MPPGTRHPALHGGWKTGEKKGRTGGENGRNREKRRRKGEGIVKTQCRKKEFPACLLALHETGRQEGRLAGAAPREIRPCHRARQVVSSPLVVKGFEQSWVSPPWAFVSYCCCCLPTASLPTASSGRRTNDRTSGSGQGRAKRARPYLF